ncbi:MAG: hypothetical protein E6I99_10760 [Chloroflexi bacterium]|nr:MAG: hypothetical protein E6I99_10760 [Chloroflexota bacterium]
MSLVDWSVAIMGTWVVVIVVAGLVMALRPGLGELEYDATVAEPLRLRQASGVMPRDRATDIKRDLGSEHPPWERLDRQGL